MLHVHTYRDQSVARCPKECTVLQKGQGILTVGLAAFMVAVMCEQDLEAGTHSPAVGAGGGGGGPSIPTGSVAKSSDSISRWCGFGSCLLHLGQASFFFVVWIILVPP